MLLGCFSFIVFIVFVVSFFGLLIEYIIRGTVWDNPLAIIEEPEALIVVIMSFLILLVIYLYNKGRVTNKNYYNDNNDGIYSHYCSVLEHSILKGRKAIYEIIIDTNKRTVFLRSDKRAKTFSFSDIKSWESRSYDLYLDHRKKGGLFITTHDFDNPIWQIMFLREKGSSIDQQYKSWMNVFDRVFNGR